MQPTTYYGPDSGAGIVLREWPTSPKRAGIVGLGAGTLAVYGNAGDTFRFYEINPQVVQFAREYFFFLKQSAAKVEIVEGDARLSLEHEDENQPRYDVLVLDAFSGDAIPVHLLTREAMALYSRRLQPQGVMAFHVSNNYLDLAPIVRQLAESAGYQCLAVKNHADKENHVLAAEWVLVTKNSRLLDNEALRLHAVAVPERRDLRIWTDDFNSLLPVLKTPEIR
jgi:spermidine synthase